MEIILKSLNKDNVDILDIMYGEESSYFNPGGLYANDLYHKGKAARIKTALKARVALAITISNKVIGFILVEGNNYSVTTGLLKEYRNKGIMSRCKNTIIKLLNSEGIFYIETGHHRYNKVMEKVVSNGYYTSVDKENLLYVNHYNPTLKDVKIGRDVKLSKLRSNIKPKVLYHISFSDSLEGEIHPKLPDGIYDEDPSSSNKNRDDFIDISEPNIPRISMSPSPDLCFRAIYPNVARFFEEDKVPYLDFHIYTVTTKGKVFTPRMLIEKKLVHDAHVTLEHYTTEKADFIYFGKYRVYNTSDDEGLYYKAFLISKEVYHSPRIIKSEITKIKKSSRW